MEGMEDTALVCYTVSMKVSYIFHSGFLIETASSYYVFDYYKGNLPTFDGSKPAVVFASHHHEDHYNPEIFSLLKGRGIGSIYAVLGRDISPKRYPDGVEVLKARGKQDYILPGGEKLHTLISTDSGVAFLLTTPEGVIYHGGDLNDWTWAGEDEGFNRQIRGCYRRRIDELKGAHIDIAMLPLDSRQGEHYADGMAYFISALEPVQVYPMHYWQQPEVIGRFIREYPQYGGRIKNTEEYAIDALCNTEDKPEGRA